MTFGDLLALRWEEAAREVGFRPSDIEVTWAIGQYPHFKTKRGYGVTFHERGPTCQLLFAEKILSAPQERADGVVRHEIGHVLDLTIPAPRLDSWAAQRGYRLPHTDERRADAIAEAVWRHPISYDRDLVQSTGPGHYPRPLHLGL